jgi:hypothetical protein
MDINFWLGFLITLTCIYYFFVFVLLAFGNYNTKKGVLISLIPFGGLIRILYLQYKVLE